MDDFVKYDRKFFQDPLTPSSLTLRNIVAVAVASFSSTKLVCSCSSSIVFVQFPSSYSYVSVFVIDGQVAAKARKEKKRKEGSRKERKESKYFCICNAICVLLLGTASTGQG